MEYITERKLHYCIYENDDVFELCKENMNGDLVLVGQNDEIISFPKKCPHCGYDPKLWRNKIVKVED